MHRDSARRDIASTVDLSGCATRVNTNLHATDLLATELLATDLQVQGGARLFE